MGIPGGDSGRAPRRLPRGAPRWFIGEVRKEIEALRRDGNAYYTIEPDHVERLLDRFRAEDPTAYLEWQPDDSDRFRSGVSGGSWGIDFDVLAPALQRFEEELRAGMTLDDWLRADLAGTATGVKGGDYALSDDQWAKLAEAAHDRRRRWPKH